MIKNNKDEISSLVRHIATAIGTVCITKGILDENAVAEITGGVTALAAVVWSIIEKRNAKKNK